MWCQLAYWADRLTKLQAAGLVSTLTYVQVSECVIFTFHLQVHAPLQPAYEGPTIAFQIEKDFVVEGKKYMDILYRS